MPDLHFLVCIKFALVYTASFYLLSLLSFLFPLVVNVFFLFLVSPSCFTISLSSSLHFTLPFTETTIFPIKSPLISSFWLSLNTEALQWGTRKTWGPEVGVRPQAWGHTAIFWAFLFMLFSFSLTTFCVCVCVCSDECMNIWKCNIWGCICAHACAHLCEWMNVCGCVCVCLCVNEGPWPGHTLLMLPPQGTSGEMDVCVCVGVCSCMFVCVYRGSCCVVKRRLVKDGQLWYDQSSVDQDVLLPPHRSFSLWNSLLTLSFNTLSLSLSFTLCVFLSLSPLPFNFLSFLLSFTLLFLFFFSLQLAVIKK